MSPTLEEIQDSLLETLHRGEPIDEPAVLAAHPAHAEALRGFFRVLDAIETPPSVAPTPARLGEFQIVRELGRGGMGIVYEALQLTLKRKVALKILPPALGGDSALALRFRREAEAAARLRHPGIVPVYSCGEVGGTPFFAMELVEGRSLAALIAELREGGASGIPAAGDARRRWAVELAAKVADALAYAHAQGIVHRDVKPANILLEHDGTPRLTDFGLALDLGHEGLTRAGEVFGSPRYMSPEQAFRRQLPIDGRSDVYSLGVTLFELLTLRFPYEGATSSEYLHQVSEGRVLRPRSVDAAIPRALERVLLRALAHEPEQRYASAAELAADLRELVRTWGPQSRASARDENLGSRASARDSGLGSRASARDEELESREDGQHVIKNTIALSLGSKVYGLGLVRKGEQPRREVHGPLLSYEPGQPAPSTAPRARGRRSIWILALALLLGIAALWALVFVVSVPVSSESVSWRDPLRPVDFEALADSTRSAPREAPSSLRASVDLRRIVSLDALQPYAARFELPVEGAPPSDVQLQYSWDVALAGQTPHWSSGWQRVEIASDSQCSASFAIPIEPALRIESAAPLAERLGARTLIHRLQLRIGRAGRKGGAVFTCTLEPRVLEVREHFPDDYPPAVRDAATDEQMRAALRPASAELRLESVSGARARLGCALALPAAPRPLATAGRVTLALGGRAQPIADGMYRFAASETGAEGQNVELSLWLAPLAQDALSALLAELRGGAATGAASTGAASTGARRVQLRFEYQREAVLLSTSFERVWSGSFELELPYRWRE